MTTPTPAGRPLQTATFELAERSAAEWRTDCIQAITDQLGEEVGGLVHELKSAIAARDAEIAEEARRAMIDCYNNGREIEDDAIVRRMRAWPVRP